MTLDFFRTQMARLNGLRFAPSDLQTHWEGLHELPDDVLSAAVDRAIRFRIEFPTPVELRQDADHEKPRVMVPAPEPPLLAEPVVLGALPTGKVVTATHEWTYYCDICGDTGLREYWCGKSERQPWLERKRCFFKNCEKLGDGYNHSWAEPCVCVSWNPDIKRRKEREAKWAAERAK